MPKYRIVLGYKNWKDAQLLAAALEGDEELEIVSASQSAQGVFDDAVAMEADVVLLSPLVTGYSPELIQDLLLHEEKPIATIGLIPAAGEGWADEMYNYGIKGHVSSPLDDVQIRRLKKLIPEAVQQALAERASDAFIPLSREALATIEDKGWQAKTFVVWAPKGGVGKTFVSVNLACAFGVLGMRRTLLIDADMSKADVHVYLGLNEEKNLFGFAIEVIEPYLAGKQNGKVEVGYSLLRKYTTHYGGERNSKLDVLVGIPRMHLAGHAVFRKRPALAKEFMEAIISTAEKNYDFRVIDVGQDFNLPFHWAAIENADVVVVPVTPELTTIRDLAHAMEALRKAFGELTRFELVVNRWDERFGISQAEIVNLLKLPKMGVIPADDGVLCVVSVNTHRPVVLDDPSPVADGIVSMAARHFPPLEDIWLRRGGKIDRGKARREKPRRRGGGIVQRLRGFFVEE